MFLSQQDIEILTGYKSRNKQARWLAGNGIRFLLAGNGKIVILQSEIEHHLCSAEGAIDKREKPNLEALR